MQFEDFEEMKLLIERRRQLMELECQGGDHPDTKIIWEQLAGLIVRNIHEIMPIIENLPVQDIFILSEVFEDISAKFKSDEWINFIEKLQKKNPEIDMSYDIIFSRKHIP